MGSTATPVRWAATLSFSWTPILTFVRRRLDLLDWFEANVEIFGFTDDSVQLGIAAGGPDERLVVDRQSLTIELLSPSATGSGLSAALTGVLGVLKPSDPTMDWYRGAWSIELGDDDYNVLRRRFANRSGGLSGKDEEMGLVPTDAAVLLDFEAPDGVVQVEFGIVSAPELTMRLANPQLGRLRATPGGWAGRPPVVLRNVPEVSIFADVTSHVYQRIEVAASEDILAALSSAEDTCRRLVATLKRNL